MLLEVGKQEPKFFKHIVVVTTILFTQVKYCLHSNHVEIIYIQWRFVKRAVTIFNALDHVDMGQFFYL